jgi:membrane-bound serine protease (ClpP class)
MRGWALALLIASVVALAVDVQVGVPRFWTGVGLLAFTFASVVLFREGIRMSWITLVVGVGGMALAFIVGMPSMVRTRFATPTIGREWMIGEAGAAVVDLSPEGIVEVRGATWRARTNRATPIAAGDAVRVVAIDGVTLEVEPETGAARDYRERRAKSA